MQLEGMDAYPFPELGEIGDPSQSMFSAMNEPASAGHSEAESTQPAKGLPGAQAQPQLHTQAQTQQRVSYARPRRGRGGRGSGRGRGGHRRSRSDHAVPWGQSQGSSGDDFESSRNAGQLERESVPSFGPGIRGTPQAQVAASASASAAAPMTMSTAVAAAGAGGGGIGASLMIASSSANPSGSGVRGNFGGVNPRSAGTRVVAEASGGGVSIGRMVGRTDAGDGGDGGASPASRVGRVTVGATPHQKLPPKPGSRHGRKTKAARGHRRTQSEPIDMLMDDDLIDMGEEDQDPFVPINNCSSSEWATLIAEEPGEAQMMSPQSLVNAKTGSFAIGSFDRSEVSNSTAAQHGGTVEHKNVGTAARRHGLATWQPGDSRLFVSLLVILPPRLLMLACLPFSVREFLDDGCVDGSDESSSCGKSAGQGRQGSPRCGHRVARSHGDWGRCFGREAERVRICGPERRAAGVW
mmetsp:Transcript_45288/g.124601  ORF Transcript_45288/g.124601 Transcript_45288/m.124601 type:complete len:467 (-) Transcript_45288:1137-2537(-)